MADGRSGTFNGAAIGNVSDGDVMIVDSVISDSESSAGSRGAIAHGNGSLTLLRTVLRNNRAGVHGGGGVC